MSAVEAEKKVDGVEEESGGELLFCGATSWDTVGRRKGLEGNLVSPTRLRPLVGVNIRYVASGCGKFRCPLSWFRLGLSSLVFGSIYRFLEVE